MEKIKPKYDETVSLDLINYMQLIGEKVEVKCPDTIYQQFLKYILLNIITRTIRMKY